MDDAIKKESRALHLIVMMFACGVEQDKMVALAGYIALPLEVDPTWITNERVRRVERWNAFYLHVYRSGLCHKGLPSTEEIARSHFGGSFQDAHLAVTYLPFWTESALPKEQADKRLGESLERMFDKRILEEEILREFESENEPRKSILKALWNTPERIEMRKKIAQHLS